MLKRRLAGFSALFISLLGLLLGVSLAQEQPSFRIGIIDDERGPITRGAVLAVGEINRAGGVQGADGTRFRLDLVVQPPDGSGRIDTAVANLSQSSVTAVLGPLTTAQVLDNLALLQRLGVPVITPAIGDTILASDASGLLLRSRAAEVFQGRALATYLVEDLDLRAITTVQLDVESTAGVVGFTTAVAALGVSGQPTLLYGTGTPVGTIVAEVLAGNPEVTVVYGPPEAAAALYLALADAGYQGGYAYSRAREAAFRDAIPLAELAGILTMDTWSISLADPQSTAFLTGYARTLGELPGAVEAATYDSLKLIEVALGQPGVLVDNLRRIEQYTGVQGALTPARLARGETSNNVSVLVLNALGGVDVVARFAGGERVPLDQPTFGVVATPTPGEPTSTPTPEGVVGTVVSDVLNVRTGPGTNFDILGRLSRGEQVPILGANLDFTWAVIIFRGQQAWISTASNLLEIFGDIRSVPIVQPPPTPTPAPATITPTPANFPDLVAISASPNQVLFNTPSNIAITVRNVGGQPAGPFAVATSWAPDNQYAAVNLPGLAPGAETTFNLPIQITSATGTFQAVIIVDLNNQVDEGPTGEANNNVFIHTYKVDRPSIANIVTLGVGTSLDVDGNGVADIVYTATGLNTTAPCNLSSYCIGLLSPQFSYDSAHYDAVAAGNGISGTSLLNVTLTPGTVIGLLTDSGRRAVARVDSINPGVSITLTYRYYP